MSGNGSGAGTWPYTCTICSYVAPSLNALFAHSSVHFPRSFEPIPTRSGYPTSNSQASAFGGSLQPSQPYKPRYFRNLEGLVPRRINPPSNSGLFQVPLSLSLPMVNQSHVGPIPRREILNLNEIPPPYEFMPHPSDDVPDIIDIVDENNNDSTDGRGRGLK